mgnify:CR=1 FL=1
MKKTNAILFIAFLSAIQVIIGQEQDNNYLEFNDRKNVVHGVYLGLTTHYGEIKDEPTYYGSLKVAYVANQQFEVGFAGTFFYSDQDFINSNTSRKEDIVGAYGGLHLEPILFSKSKVNLSFPVLVGIGGVGSIDDNFNNDDFEDDFDYNDVDFIFVAETGVNLLFNVSRYLQLESGIKYRFSSRMDIDSNPTKRLNGFSAGLGIKVGVFNMGRNKYNRRG